MRGRATRCIENESQQTLSRVDDSEAPNERKAGGGAYMWPGICDDQDAGSRSLGRAYLV